jgi:hypothetical protein
LRQRWQRLAEKGGLAAIRAEWHGDMELLRRPPGGVKLGEGEEEEEVVGGGGGGTSGTAAGILMMTWRQDRCGWGCRRRKRRRS